METHLSIKHIAPYLPYGLECYLQGHKDEFDKPIKESILGLYDECETKVYVSLGAKDYDTYNIIDVFPILTPLSDLNQEGEIHTVEYIQSCMYQYVEYLLKNHYDIYGLIEKGLAIDINTIN